MGCRHQIEHHGDHLAVGRGLFKIEIGGRSSGLNGGDEFVGDHKNRDAESFCLGDDLLVALGAPLKDYGSTVRGSAREFLRTLSVWDANQCVSRVAEGSRERDSEACAEVEDIFHSLSGSLDSAQVLRIPFWLIHNG